MTLYLLKRLYKAPQVQLTHKTLMLMLLEQRLEALIYAREFSCTHSMVEKYTELRREFFSDNNGALGVLIQQGKKQRAQDFWDSAKDNIRAEFARQLLWEYCGIDLPEVSIRYWPREGMRGFYSGLATVEEGVYAREIEILENELNMTRINESKPTITKKDIENSRSTK